MERPAELPARPSTQQVARARPYDADNSHPEYALRPARVLSIFQQAESGHLYHQCELFDGVIERDAHLRNLFEQRAQGVAGKPWTLQADGTDGDAELAALVLGKALRKLAMVEVFEHQLSFNRYGYAASEIDWGLREIDGRRWTVPIWFANVPARRFCEDPATGELKLITESLASGVALDPGRWLVTKRAQSRLARAGLMRTATWLALFKTYSTRDWVLFSERFGLPLVMAIYDALAGSGATDEQSAADIAAKIVKNIGSDGGAVVPDSVKVQIVEARASGDNTGTHGGLIAHCNREMSKLINGSTLSNDNGDSGGASYALGEVHASVRWDNVVWDAERLQEAFRMQVCEPFMRFNGLRGEAPLMKVQVVRDLEPRQRVEVADMFVNKLGVPVSVSQLRQETGFREPLGEADAAKGAPKPEPVAPGAAQPEPDQDDEGSNP